MMWRVVCGVSPKRTWMTIEWYPKAASWLDVPYGVVLSCTCDRFH